MSNTEKKNPNDVLAVADALKAQGMALINIDINGSDFKRSLSYKDLGLSKDVERELATLGRKAVLGKEYPLQLRKNKEQVYTYMDKMGVRFGSFGTWAVPLDIYNEVHVQLKAKQDERNIIKDALVQNYQQELDKFADAAEALRPGFGEIVRKNAFDKDHIIEQISMNISAQEDIMGGIATGAVQGLGRIAREYEQSILKAAKKANTRPVITRFTRSKLQEMEEYCMRFMFLTSVLNDASVLIKKTIAELPATVVKGESYLDETSKVLTALKLLQTADELEGVVSVPVNDSTVVFDDYLDSESESELQGSNSSPITNAIESKVQETDAYESISESPISEPSAEPASVLDLLGDVGDDDDYYCN
ncbi:DUF3150 domain-containing protein [Vibrio sp. Evd11]|uniref:DUF3150 domain-containing protein n=1 Tax=Vibrio sp. Evd11 TaxID=1207404 RepID=UPI000EFB2C68|nr:DUF3150 domain-containing protein [Vibrio sp. Evd11]